MKKNVLLGSKLHEQLKHLAIKEKTTLEALVNKMLQQSLPGGIRYD